ncbi:c-type cytochrome [Gammaproteobacteria bacterium LSUCC0112]|nr:c-type cytochrome [Gammaproteobacteria bacterium LSUCC0112]
MAHTHKLLLMALVSAGCLGSAVAQETASDDPVYRAFLAALGEPALIGANADHALANSAYRPIPALRVDELDANKMRLGFDLFHENRFAIDQSVGCNSCHSGMFGGTDGRKVSTGARGQLGNLNAPTTFNAAFNFRQFWDGRAVTLADQALGPIENELEMAHELPAVIDMLRQDERYSAEFAAVYPDGITVNNMADAIAYFQRVNFTRPTTPFVRHLAGEEGQLSEQALRGLQRFEDVGCVTCHNGINLGGNSYQQLGSALDYFVEHRTDGPNDNGVFNRTGRESDKHVFKVPTLHGVAETAPYFHDGSVDTLEAAIEEMAEHQLGRMLSQQDIDDIAAFLNSLGGRPMGMAMGSMGMGRGMRGGMMGGGMNGGMGMGRGMQGTPAPAEPTADPATESSDTAMNNTALHQAQYQDALRAVAQARDKMVAEMQRIQRNDVAHFDFLQYEHLELIRHARALAYPPVTVDADTQQKLQDSAAQLLTATHELEWVIADFVRAEAMSRVMERLANNEEPNSLEGQAGDPVQRRAQYQAASVAMLAAMQTSAIQALAQTVNEVYAAGI